MRYWYASFILCAMIAASEARNCSCGIERPVSRVINGRKASIGHFPWVVRVTKNMPRSKTYCTGSIISNLFVLTAAHCVPKNRNASAMRVILSQRCGYTEDSDKDASLEREVISVIRSRRYVDHWHVGNDIALLELRIPLPTDENYMPVCLSDTQLYDNFLVVGWGNINNGSQLIHSQCLNEAELEIVSNRQCWYTHPNANFKLVVCAGGQKSNICYGDSGGPLMTRKFGFVFQSGISSFVRTGCLSGKPSAFERIPPHLPWIMKNTKDTVCLP